jgi:hypothetical protein
MHSEPSRFAPVSRRAFLSSGLAAAGGLVAASAFGSAAVAAVDPDRLVPLVLSSDLYATSQPQRFVFGYQRGGSFTDYASGPPTIVRFRSPGGRWSPFTRAPLDRAGLPKGRGVYVSAPVFSEPGVWKVEARASGQRIRFAAQVYPQPTAPIPGMAAPRAPSPTLANTLGVDPICTRDPQCPLHTVSLASVIGAGKPVAALFATPARCQSLYCGPVLDRLLKTMKAYEDRATFVHVEIYQDSRSNAVSPTVAAWGLPSEPWLFGIDGAGTVVSRIDGAFGGAEMNALLQQLV